MFAPITALFAAAALLPGLASSATLSGLGTISVINSSSYMTATPDQSIGCIDASGRLVMDSCATFEFRDAYPNGIFTDAGNCSFTDASQPANTDSRYGAGSYAWSCWTHQAVVTDQIYTIVSPRFPSSSHMLLYKKCVLLDSVSRLSLGCEITTADHVHRPGWVQISVSLPGRYKLLL